MPHVKTLGARVLEWLLGGESASRGTLYECPVCGSPWGFANATYHDGAGSRCPALACRRCGALTLHEAAAETEDERARIRAMLGRRARAVRAAT